jgi:hypothetical protein
MDAFEFLLLPTILDGLIILAGAFFCFVQLNAVSRKLPLAPSLSPKDREDLKKEMVTKSEWISLAIDCLPLAGLIGTVWALMGTMAQIKVNVESIAIINKFAPALTTTFWGILFAIINLAIYRTKFTPNLKDAFPE